MKILFLIVSLFISNYAQADDIGIVIKQLMDAARESVSQGDQIFDDLQNQVFDNTRRRTGVKHQFHQTKDTFTVEIDIPKGEGTEFNLDIKKGNILISVIKEKKSRNSFSQRSYQDRISLPLRIDYEKPRIVQKDGKLFVHFKKI